MTDQERGFSVAAAAKRLERKFREAERAAEERRLRAKAWAREIAARLGETDPTLVCVYGFGSTFETWRSYRLNSDIDLGVIGGDWNLLMKTVPRSEFEVSIVELEIQNTEFADYVKTHGTVLYEKR